MFGGKNGSGVFQTIISLMPPHDTYIEPFLGSGAVMRRKAPALQSVGIDMDPTVIANYSGQHRRLELLHTDAFAWLADFKPADRTVIYCDPPYVHETRTSNKRYKHELTNEQHVVLLTILKRLDCAVMVSGYQNPIYSALLADWRSVSFQAMTRGGVRTETVWLNFDPGDPHYHTYAGRDYTERQRIKRKAANWGRRYAALPAEERQAVMAAMLTSIIDEGD